MSKITKKTIKYILLFSLWLGIFMPYQDTLAQNVVAEVSDSLEEDSIPPVPPIPLVVNLDRPFVAVRGLEGRHVALWGSHGLYFELGNARWEWQRARMFETVEDKFPSSIVIPYVIPMLENAGAITLLPRERDANPFEVVVDNDGHLAHSPYDEHNGHHAWKSGHGKGFSYAREAYKAFENPFLEGSYRETVSTTDEDRASTVTWTPEIPVSRRYAVYVSYKTVANSTEDAQYTVYHKGGETTFLVNQTMGGGTWVYLGTFAFDKGKRGKVVLSNFSASDGRVVTADAVRFGGGMGNIARFADGTKVYENTKIRKGNAQSGSRTQWQPTVETCYEVSGYPRYMEGARYYLQWAGVPGSVFSPTEGKNDYTDDYRCRGAWVNYLAGGSRSLPNSQGLNIPIDLSLAFHSDAGTVGRDEVIGTLGIYNTRDNGGRLGDGSSRSANRVLTTTVYNSILDDIRRQIEPRWSGRGCMDKSYSESTVPRVPSALIELMSHESFGEMRYGLDPRFRFVVGRAIYKGVLRFMSQRYGFDYVVQPLPVSHMAATLDGDHAVLSWRPEYDSLESTAIPECFIVYKRIGDGDFDNGEVVEDTIFSCEIPTNEVVSFKVTALNEGGQSMPSEIISVGRSSDSKTLPVLVINGFDRVSGPDDFSSSDDRIAGFLADEDNGVPYISNISFVGKQKEFRRSIPMVDDDSPGFGACNGNEERIVIAGNSFDYPALHGRSILESGYSFVSVSRASIENLLPLLDDSLQTLNGMYSAIDLILGKQKQSKLGRLGASPLAFKTFDDNMQTLLTGFCRAGGPVFVSGSYVATDLWQNPLVKAQDADKKFVQSILKYKWRDGKAAVDGKVKFVSSPLGGKEMEFDYFNKANEESYVVESPDAIIPAESSAFTAMRYSENGQSAAVVFGGNATDKWRTVVLGFPFESIKDAEVRNKLMKRILNYLFNKK